MQKLYEARITTPTGNHWRSARSVDAAIDLLKKDVPDLDEAQVVVEQFGTIRIVKHAGEAINE